VSGHRADQHHHAHAHSQPDDLRRRLTRRQACLQLGNQVSQRHIHKAAAGHHQKIRQPVVQSVDQNITYSPPKSRDRPGHGDFDNGRLAAAAALAQNGQVTHMVWHFMRHHSQGRNHAQANVCDEGRSDQNAIAKTMHAVTGQHRPLASR
jgi:hypothetical protein